MKKVFTFCFMPAGILIAKSSFAILSYGLTVTTPGFTAVTGATTLFTNACGDGLVCSAQNIGFTFVYDSHNYTQFQVTENGRLFLGNSVVVCDDNCGAGCDGFGPNYQIQPSSGAGNGLGGSVIHPTICPLWDDQGLNVAGSKVSFVITGTAGNKVLTVEWLKVTWKFSNANTPNSGTISFQVKIYESPAGQIDFIYKQEPQPMGAIPQQHGKIGLTGFTAGDYYFTTATGAAPAKTGETDVITKPADGTQFRWSVGVPTPIELILFSGKNKGDTNTITWETIAEINNKFFTLDRSIDAVNFEHITYVSGAGNSSQLLKYSYTDGALPKDYSTIYYRLKQTDFDGNFFDSEIISVDCERSSKPPDIYYNMNSGILNVSFQFVNRGTYRLYVVDILGKVIQQENLFVTSEGRNEFPVSLSFLPDGVYSVKVWGDDVMTQTKFVNY